MVLNICITKCLGEFLISNCYAIQKLSVKMEKLEKPMIHDEDPVVVINKRNQYLAGIAVSIGAFCAGSAFAWTSPASQFLMETNETSNNSLPGFTITTAQEATVGGILLLGGLIFALPSEKCANWIGRKWTLILVALMFLIHFSMLACAVNFTMLVVARFLAGMALGGISVLVPMFIGEMADESVSGLLGSLFNAFLQLGLVYVNVVGIFTHWLGLGIALIIPSALSVLVLFPIQDTAMYFIAKNKIHKAKNSLMFYRDNNEQVANEELDYLQKKHKEHEDGGTLKDLFTKQIHRKALLAGSGVFIYQQFCGINVIMFYLVPIFKAAGNTMDPLVAASITNIISFGVSLASVLIIEKRGRKYFLILSAACMLIGCMGIGLFFHLEEHKINFPGMQLLPISSLVLFMAGFAIGLGPVPWILLIELYSPEIRGVASGVNMILGWFGSFLATFTFPFLVVWIGNSWTFYFYGLINVLGILFMWWYVPETRNK